jgi:hypothetical protein
MFSRIASAAGAENAAAIPFASLAMIRMVPSSATAPTRLATEKISSEPRSSRRRGKRSASRPPSSTKPP